MSIKALTQSIADHAVCGPSETPGQAQRNTLSPHFQRMVEELVRAYLIKHTHETIEKVSKEFQALLSNVSPILEQHVKVTLEHVNQEFDSLIGITPPVFVSHLQMTKNRVNAMISLPPERYVESLQLTKAHVNALIHQIAK